MKAVLLAAGKGERLGNITRTIPKPMLTIMGKPVIVHNIEMCRRSGITDIYINLHSLPEVITGYLGDGKKFGVTITYSYEETILGTAGAVRNLAEKLRDDRFFVVYADNYSNYDLKVICHQHVNTGADMSVALFSLEDTSASGVALLDKDNWLFRFVEKPKGETIDNCWINAGIYLVEPKLLDLIPPGFSDFGQDIIPRLIANGSKILGVKMKTPTFGLDTIERLKKANNLNE